jgi:hypothetical protein
MKIKYFHKIQTHLLSSYSSHLNNEVIECLITYKFPTVTYDVVIGGIIFIVLAIGLMVCGFKTSKGR